MTPVDDQKSTKVVDFFFWGMDQRHADALQRLRLEIVRNFYEALFSVQCGAAVARRNCLLRSVLITAMIMERQTLHSKVFRCCCTGRVSVIGFM